MDVCDPVQLSAPPAISPNASAERSSLPDQVLRIIDSRRRWLLLGILVLYLLGFNAQWRVERDSALYLTIARNLATGQGYTYLGLPQHLAFPGLPLLFAGVSRVFHSSGVVPDLILMLLMGFATLGLTYRLFLLHAGRPTAMLMMVGLAASRLFYRYCFELLSDLPFLLGVMAFLVGYEAVFFRKPQRASAGNSLAADRSPVRWFDWMLLFAGLALAVVMRPTMWILLLAIVLATAWNFLRSVNRSSNRSSMAWTHIALAVLVIAAAVVFFMADPRRGGSVEVGQYEDYIFSGKFGHLSQTLKQTFTSNIPDLFEATLAKALFGCPIGPGINTLAGMVVIGLSFWLLWYRPLWGLWPVLTIGTLLIFKPLDRYMLPVIPLLIFAWWRFLVWLHGQLPRKWADLAFLALLITGATTNLARLSQIVVEQRRVPFLAHYHDGRYISMQQVGNLIRQHVRKTDWVVAGPKVGRIMTYASHRHVIKAADYVVLDPNATGVYALLGPSWDDDGHGKVSSRPDDLVPVWLARNGFQLGPQIGPAIINKPEKERWTLHRVYSSQPRSGQPSPADSKPLRPGTDD